MKKEILAGLFISLLVIMVGFAIAKPPRTSSCPIDSTHNIVVYGDTGLGGVGDLSKSWINHFFGWWELQDPSINYVFVDANDIRSDCNLSSYPNIKLYVQPGGDAYYQQKSLGPSGKNNILNYINKNDTAYLGICAGFYYAANDYYWQGSYYNWPDMLDIFPTVEGSITNIADYDSNPGYALTTLSNGHNSIYYGGPTQGWANTNINLAGGEKLASFSAIPGDVPAIVRMQDKLLTSIHLEAYENDGINGLTTEQRIENYKLLANLINDASGTNYYVPAYNNQTVLTQCSDNVDNDADGLIDLVDPGCLDVNDNDESDTPQGNGTGILFSDDFESGSLSGWTLTKVSGANNWVNANINSYLGLRHAQSQPMSTTNPASVMERTISTLGYSNIKVSYYRKLVGLDSADEFQVKWYDGSNWNVLEQTGSNSANDASYVAKSFALPLSAGNNANFKIKFECTAGAVSEICRVDNIVVLSN